MGNPFCQAWRGPWQQERRAQESCGLQSPRAVGSAQRCSFSAPRGFPTPTSRLTSPGSVFFLEARDSHPSIQPRLGFTKSRVREMQPQTPLGLPWANRTGNITPCSRGALGISSTPLPDISSLGAVCFLLPSCTHTPGTTTQSNGCASSHPIDHPWFGLLVSKHPCPPGYTTLEFNLAKQASLRASPPHKPPPEEAQWGRGVGGVLQDALQTVGCTLRTSRDFSNLQSTSQTRALHHHLLEQLFGVLQRHDSPVHFQIHWQSSFSSLSFSV